MKDSVKLYLWNEIMKRKRIFLGIITALTLLSCEGKLFGVDFRDFSGQFTGEYIGVFYQSKGGEVVYFDSTSAPIIFIGNQIKVTVNQSVKEHLMDTWADKNKSTVKKRNGTLIMYGEDKDRNKKSLRLTATENPQDFGAAYSIIVSNFILGDYNSSKDTVDIYYKYTGDGISSNK